MRNYFEFLMKQLLSLKESSGVAEEIKSSDFEITHINLEFRKILDKLAIHIVKKQF